MKKSLIKNSFKEISKTKRRFLSILIMACIKLVICYKKDEITGIKLKKEDGTHGTADWSM